MMTALFQKLHVYTDPTDGSQRNGINYVEMEMQLLSPVTRRNSFDLTFSVQSDYRIPLLRTQSLVFKARLSTEGTVYGKISLVRREYENTFI